MSYKGQYRQAKQRRPGRPGSSGHKAERDERLQDAPSSQKVQEFETLPEHPTAQRLRQDAVLDLQQRYGNTYTRQVIGQGGAASPLPGATSHTVQLAPKNKLDATAQAIIATAADSSKSLSDRAVQVVNDIIKTYYPSQAGLVKKVVYKESEPGLLTTVATSKTAQGIISVGKYFVTNTDEKGFARRVLQVDHELEHIRQHRSGMGGPKTEDLREFLAFTREALAPEVAGTGRVSHSTRVSLIDGALNHYYKMGKDDRKKHEDKRDKLLEARKDHVAKSGRKYGPPPGP